MKMELSINGLKNLGPRDRDIETCLNMSLWLRMVGQVCSANACENTRSSNSFLSLSTTGTPHSSSWKVL